MICGKQDGAGGGDSGLASPGQPGISEVSGRLLGRRVRYWERDPCPTQKGTGLGLASSLPALLPSIPAGILINYQGCRGAHGEKGPLPCGVVIDDYFNKTGIVLRGIWF